MLSIDSIGLSNRSQNALHRAEIHTVGDMLGYTAESLSEIRNLGNKSIEEILKKIEEYREIDEAGGLPDDEPTTASQVPENFDDWIKDAVGKEYVLSWLQKKECRIDSLELLSVRAYNLLLFNGYDFISQIAFIDEQELLQLPRMEAASAGEIIRLCRHFLQDHSATILADYASELEMHSAPPAPTIFDMLGMPEYHDSILKYVRANDKDVRQLGLSNRPINRLLNKGVEKLSDIIFMSRSELQKIPAMGTASVEEIMAKINDYLSANESRMIAVCTGDESALLNDEAIRDLILKQYQEIGFSGLSRNEMKERLRLPDSITDVRLKKIIGGLLASGDLEYVDFRCYRIYGALYKYL